MLECPLHAWRSVNSLSITFSPMHCILHYLRGPTPSNHCITEPVTLASPKSSKLNRLVFLPSFYRLIWNVRQLTRAAGHFSRVASHCRLPVVDITLSNVHLHHYCLLFLSLNAGITKEIYGIIMAVAPATVR